MIKVSLFLLLSTFVLTMMSLVPSAHAQLNPNDIIVLDPDADVEGDGTVLFKVNPSNGQRTIITDFPRLIIVNARQMAVDPAGSIFILESFPGERLIRVNPSDGSPTIISDFLDGNQGPVLGDPGDLAIDLAGNIFVLARDLNFTRSVVVRVDPSNGRRTIIGPGVDPLSGGTIAVDLTGNILISDLSSREIIKMNPADGSTTIISDFDDENLGPVGAPGSLAVDSRGNIFAIVRNAGTAQQGALFKVNPLTGRRTIISDFGDFDMGPVGQEQKNLAVDSAGNILVVDSDVGTDLRGLLFKINPSNGNRTILSDFGNSSMGPLGGTPNSMAVKLAPVSVRCNGLLATIIGTLGNDTLNGTNGRDIIHGLGGRDTIKGFMGNDVICGGDGNDSIGGDRGNDLLFGQGGSDVLDGSFDADQLFGSLGNDTLRGASGNDVLFGGPGLDTLQGGFGLDTLDGGIGNDTLNGNQDNDTLRGGNGSDRLNGGLGTDSCDGGSGSDTGAGCETIMSIP